MTESMFFEYFTTCTDGGGQVRLECGGTMLQEKNAANRRWDSYSGPCR